MGVSGLCTLGDLEVDCNCLCGNDRDRRWTSLPEVDEIWEKTIAGIWEVSAGLFLYDQDVSLKRLNKERPETPQVSWAVDLPRPKPA